MEIKPQTILGINQGTRYIGLAVFSGTVLCDWAVKTIRGQWSDAKLKKAIRMVEGLIDLYQPAAIAMKRFDPCRSSGNIRKLSESIRQAAKTKRIKIFEYSITELKRRHSGEEAIRNKKQLAQILASQYPDLYFELAREKKNRNSYHTRMFEAVALAALANDQ